MKPNKTNYTDTNVIEFINTIEDNQKKMDTITLIELMQNIVKTPAKMFGSSIIGFGKYHYKYNSGHEGEAPLLGFSPRKNAISLYIYTGNEEHLYLLEKLGKFTMGKACIYVKKLSDIDLKIAKELMRKTVAYLSEKYTRID